MRWLAMSEIVKKIGERIRLIRREKGLSQEQLGELSDLHTNYVGQIERGEKNLTIESLEKVVQALEISMEQLFRHVDPMKDKDELMEINELLSERSSKDHAMVLKIIKSVLDWEREKYQ
jgi:transcriptional regulator with XRE-family HTH domain